MNINWKVRLKSGPFWLGVASAVIMAVFYILDLCGAAPELTELNFGVWEGCSWAEIGERWPEQFSAYAADRRNYAPPGGES